MDNPYLFNFALGQQYEAIGDLEKAETAFSPTASGTTPSSRRGSWPGCSSSTGRSATPRSWPAVEGLARVERFALEYHLLKGTALFGLERYDAALDELLAANKIYNSDVRVLNLLGFTFFRLGDLEEALKAFDASLKPERQVSPRSKRWPPTCAPAWRRNVPGGRGPEVAKRLDAQYRPIGRRLISPPAPAKGIAVVDQEKEGADASEAGRVVVAVEAVKAVEGDGDPSPLLADQERMLEGGFVPVRSGCGIAARSAWGGCPWPRRRTPGNLKNRGFRGGPAPSR